MVEHSAHNGKVIGSNPVKLIFTYVRALFLCQTVEGSRIRTYERFI